LLKTYKESAKVGTVQEELQTKKGWAYTTVKTMMDRMVNHVSVAKHHLLKRTLLEI
jgi:predicted transcriptional regulator